MNTYSNLFNAHIFNLKEYENAVFTLQQKYLASSNYTYDSLLLRTQSAFVHKTTEQIDDIRQYEMTSNNTYYDSKSNSYKLLLKPLN